MLQQYWETLSGNGATRLRISELVNRVLNEMKKLAKTYQNVVLEMPHKELKRVNMKKRIEEVFPKFRFQYYDWDDWDD